MTKTTIEALDELVDSARLLGSTQAKKGFGCYTEEDSRFERAMHESIAKHRAALAALSEQPEANSASWRDLCKANSAIVDEIREIVGLTGKPGNVVEAVRKLTAQPEAQGEAVAWGDATTALQMAYEAGAKREGYTSAVDWLHDRALPYTAAPKPGEGVTEPWYGHRFCKGRDDRWRCADGCGPVLVEEAQQPEAVAALEVFRIAGGDVECSPNPTAAQALDCLRDLRECYDEVLAGPEAQDEAVLGKRLRRVLERALEENSRESAIPSVLPELAIIRLAEERQAILLALGRRPECANGCPPMTVCDTCQGTAAPKPVEGVTPTHNSGSVAGKTPADLWAEGYAQGVCDERTSHEVGPQEGGARIEPARVNPYALTPATPQGVRDGR